MKLISALNMSQAMFGVKAVVLAGKVYLYTRRPKYAYDWFYADEEGNQPLMQKDVSSDQFTMYSPDIHEEAAKSAFPNLISQFTPDKEWDAKKRKT